MLNMEELHVHSRRAWLYKALQDYTRHIEMKGEAGNSFSGRDGCMRRSRVTFAQPDANIRILWG